MNNSVLSKIDYSVLKATATESDIIEAAKDTEKFNFATLCVFPKHIEIARKILPEKKVSTVIGFPLSSIPLSLKLKEIEFSLEKGAGEFDIVVNLSAIKEKNWTEVEKELKEIRKLTDKKVIKLIFECCYLTEEEKRILCKLAIENGWDYLKTSTGYGKYGAKDEDVKLLVSCSQGRAKVKASGGIRNLESTLKFIELGVDRIGTSAGKEIAYEVLHCR
ncbi:deoxyribose-phosphate aldolase [Desulfurobacterium thermolithotrophum]|uniref:deoxyribose-phosphate aldolase n=1 Tax=Desulfurobacterium thermolithotrophum TaxID=64160 RepID=UPI0013CFE7A5|nr:deoxyribose-phosphate aldolase [Desulfurobacterium thermolithotrophum]